MFRRNLEQEYQQVADFVDYVDSMYNEIPPRLARKLKSVPRLSFLEQMFQEPSSSDDEDNNRRIPNSSRLFGQRYPQQIVSNNAVSRAGSAQNVIKPSCVLPNTKINHCPSNAVNKNTITQRFDSPIDLTGDVGDDDDSDDTDSDDDVTGMREQKSHKLMILPSTSTGCNESNIMDQIIKRIFAPITESHNSRTSKPPSPNPNPAVNSEVILIEQPSETPTWNDSRMEVQENQIAQLCNSGNNEITNCLTNNKRRRTCHSKVIPPNSTRVLRSQNKYVSVHINGNSAEELNNEVEKKIQRVVKKLKTDKTNNSITNWQTNKSKKKSNSVHIYNIVVKKCGHSKISSAKKAKKSSVTKDRNFGECPICLENLTATSLRSTHCGHLFCVSCISSVFNSGNAKCPTCRGLLKPYGYHKLYL